jgi:hypothetical protein
VGATLGNLAGILLIVTGAIAALFGPQLVSGSAQFSSLLATGVLALCVIAIALFVAGCVALLRDTARARRVEADHAHDHGETFGALSQDDAVAPSYAPREPFILSLPAAALVIAAAGLVLELLEVVDILPSRVIPLALALAVAFAAFLIIRRLQRNLAHARAHALFAEPPAP